MEVYGGSYMIPALTREVKDKEEFTFGKHIRVRCVLLFLLALHYYLPCLAGALLLPVTHRIPFVFMLKIRKLDRRACSPGKNASFLVRWGLSLTFLWYRDTLFMAGCGRFFEGTAAEMHKALAYLSSLPDDTITYNGHEYTASSVAFGAHVCGNIFSRLFRIRLFVSGRSGESSYIKTSRDG